MTLNGNGVPCGFFKTLISNFGKMKMKNSILSVLRKIGLKDLITPFFKRQKTKRRPTLI